MLLSNFQSVLNVVGICYTTHKSAKFNSTVGNSFFTYYYMKLEKKRKKLNFFNFFLSPHLQGYSSGTISSKWRRVNECHASRGVRWRWRRRWRRCRRRSGVYRRHAAKFAAARPSIKLPCIPGQIRHVSSFTFEAIRALSFRTA